MSGIGAALKEARTKKELTFEDVHAKIKVHPRVLQLLEEEKFEKLPSPLFVKSFLRSYAQFLDVNAEELLESYEKEKKVEEPEQKLYLKPASMTPERRVPKSWWIGGGVLALLFALSLSGAPAKFGAWTKNTFKRPPAAAKVKKPKIVKVEKPEPAAIEEKVANTWLNSAKLGNFPKLKRGTPLELEIKAIDSVWVHVTGDGKVLFQGVIKKGASEAWKVKEMVEIWTGNASNMTLSLNRYALGSPGKGVVKKMIVSHDGVRIASSGA